MALTDATLAGALRIGDGVNDPEEPVLSVVRRLREVGEALVDKHATKDLPDAVRDESVVRFCGYSYDMPESPRGDGYAAAFRNSGALALLGPWRIRRAGSIG